MITPLIFLALTSSPSEIPPAAWACTSQVEVWCAVDGCAAKAEDETTPLSVWAREDGEVSVCAYTGCWEGRGDFSNTGGRLVWAAENLPFSSGQGGFSADVSLMIISGEGVGFVRAGGLATPLLCLRAEPGAAR